jgi:hypothetical protein
MAQNTGLQRDCKDQFYTCPAVAQMCVALLRKHAPTSAQWIEPSAGTGVFLDLVPDATGYDLEPLHPRIRQADFLQVDLPEGCVVYGNPPFGRQASLAKKFLRHAAERADWIGFILPRSFVKPSMQKAIPLNFHLVECQELPENSFVVNGEPYDVPCVFQVWEWRPESRAVEISPPPSGFRYVAKTDTHHLAFRRVGVNAGKCCLPSDTLSVQSHYFVQLDDPNRAQSVVTASQTHVFPTNTTGPRSLSKQEATDFLSAALAAPGR